MVSLVQYIIFTGFVLVFIFLLVFAVIKVIRSVISDNEYAVPRYDSFKNVASNIVSGQACFLFQYS